MAQIPLTTSRTTRIKADLILLLVAIIWGSAFVAQRVAAQNISVYLFNGTRFMLGTIVLLPFLFRSRSNLHMPKTGYPTMMLAGLLLFAGTSLQQHGMRWTTAANAGFITGLYVVLIPIILALFIRQPPRKVIWLAAILASLGLFLLSTGGSLRLAPGDAFELLGALMWALHVLLIGWLVKRVDIFALSVIQYSVCSALSLALAFLMESNSFGNLSGYLWTVLYTGIFSIGIGYTLQAVGQKVAPPADAAIILSLEAVVAATAGWLLLGENLSGIQVAGCGLMLVSMVIAQLYPA